jgi:hypothetical protein
MATFVFWIKTSKYTKSGIIHSQYLVMEAGVIQCDILNHSRYQLQSEEQTQTRSRRTRRTGKGARSN